MEPAVTLLHLSDLQFGPLHRFDQGDTLGSLLGRLRQDFDALRDEEGFKPDVIMLTGDLAEWGLKSQFAEVSRFADGVARLVDLERRRVVLIPGNHDINRKACEAYFSECAADEMEPQPPYWPKLRHYAEFFAKFYEGYAGIAFTEAQPWTFFEYPELRLVVAGLNSAMADSHRDEDHYGYLGEMQIRAFVEKLRLYREQGWLRIGAVHHDLLHPPETNERARQDLKDLKRMLGPYLNLVLHGHLHEEQVEWLDGSVPVLGIGSAGIESKGRPPEVPNQYQIVKVYKDRVRLGSRAYVPDQKRWIGDLRADPDGRTWVVEKKVAFERVETTFSGATAAEVAPRAELAEVVQSYRSYVAKAYRREPLFDVAGRAEDADIPGGLDLLRIFVPQTVRRALPVRGVPEMYAVDEDDLPLPEEFQIASDWETQDLSKRPREPEGPPVAVDSVLTSLTERWVLLVGAPGAGKSTITRWLMLKLCTSGESLEPLSSDLVPVRIEMRRFDLQYSQAKDAGRSYHFFDYLDEVHGERSLALRKPQLEQLAQGGRLLWLFDGLDEVTDARARRDYAEMIVGVKDRFHGRGVVTSRIVGARPVQPLLQEGGVTSYTLLDFDTRQGAAFLIAWHRLAFPDASEVGEQRRERLIKTIDDSRAVRELCGNPLLLTLIALLNRGGELPRRRHLIYERVVELMASQWEANKDLPKSAASRFDLLDKRRFLRGLAFRMMTELPRGPENLVAIKDLLDFATSFCREIYGEEPEAARRTAELLVQHLRERDSVLCWLGGQTYGFVHKTLLEYLAAAEIHVRFRSRQWEMARLQEVFHEHWQDTSWEEILTLICGMLEEDRAEHIVHVLQGTLARISPFDGSSLYRFVAFAVRCLGEMMRLDQEPIRTFAVRLDDLLAKTLKEVGAPDTEWKPTLTNLANHAKDEQTRLNAAKVLIDAGVLGQLAENAADEKVRNEARNALELLRLHRALLTVARRRRGRVALDGTPVGHIEETPYGTRFTYDPDYITKPNAIPISPTLPLRKDPYESQGLHSFFENLLPEGWLLDLTLRKLSLDRTDAFGLLLATGSDMAGAVEVTPEDRMP